GDANNPKRFFVDLAPAKLNASLAGKQWQVKSGILDQIRVGQYDASTVRVVLEVGSIVSISTFTLRDPDRLIIDVLGKEATPAVASGGGQGAAPSQSTKSVPTPAVLTASVPAVTPLPSSATIPARATTNGT